MRDSDDILGIAESYAEDTNGYSEIDDYADDAIDGSGEDMFEGGEDFDYNDVLGDDEDFADDGYGDE